MDHADLLDRLLILSRTRITHTEHVTIEVDPSCDRRQALSSLQQ
jgi:hypothetical protein